MNNLGRFEGASPRPISPMGEELINNLPPEMLQSIFSKLPFADLLNATLVCHLWKNQTLEAVAFLELSKIKTFQELLTRDKAIPSIENASSSEESDSCNFSFDHSEDTASDSSDFWLIPINNIKKQTNLYSLKSLILSVKAEFIYKLLKEPDLETITQQSQHLDYPLFFDEIFEFADYLKTADEFIKSNIFMEIAVKLVRDLLFEISVTPAMPIEGNPTTTEPEVTNSSTQESPDAESHNHQQAEESGGSMDAIFQLAIKFARMIDSESFSQKIEALTEISVALATVGYFDQAVNIANMSNIERDKVNRLFDMSISYCDAFFEITKRLGKNGQIQQANEMAQMIDDESDKQLAFEAIADALADQDNFHDAVEVTNSINSEAAKSRVLKRISIKIADLDDFPYALDVANSIHQDTERSSALEKISIKLAASGNFSYALDVANSIHQETERSSALKQISIELAAKGDFANALQVAHSIDVESEKSNALKKISIELAATRDFSKAEEVAKSIASESQRILAYRELCKKLTAAGDVENAIKVAYSTPFKKQLEKVGFEEVSIPEENICILANISEILADKGDFLKACEIADLIDEETQKSYALSVISRKLVAIGDFEQARKVADSISEDTRRWQAQRFYYKALYGK